MGRRLVRQAASTTTRTAFLKESTRQIASVSLVPVTKATQITRKAEMKLENENNETPLLAAMLGLAFCSSIIHLGSAGAELAGGRTLSVIFNSSNVANAFLCFLHVPANGPAYLSHQFSTVLCTELHYGAPGILSPQNEQSK